MLPAIFGLAGPALTDAETRFFKACDPAGYILFARNCVDPDQLRALTATLCTLSGRDTVPILIDQEGGRVVRLRPPHWPDFPAAQRFAERYSQAPGSAMEATRLNALAIALTLRDCGINVDCLPVLDVRDPGGHDIIGDRAFGNEPMQVAALGRACLDGLQAGGVVGVIKHVPGHGRASADSHVELPRIDADRAALERDFAPFRTLRAAPMAMTAHVLYSALDPDNCASTSAAIIERIIRQDIGFDGLLMSDDLGMHALSGDFGARARDVLAAGCDIALHCSGEIAEMEAVAAACPAMTDRALARLEQAMAWAARVPLPVSERSRVIAQRDALLGLASQQANA